MRIVICANNEVIENGGIDLPDELTPGLKNWRGSHEPFYVCSRCGMYMEPCGYEIYMHVNPTYCTCYTAYLVWR